VHQLFGLKKWVSKELTDGISTMLLLFH